LTANYVGDCKIPKNKDLQPSTPMIIDTDIIS